MNEKVDSTNLEIACLEQKNRNQKNPPTVQVKPRVVIFAGPTAVGKTGLALDFARYMKSRGKKVVLINGDALAVYRDMYIGTASPSKEEQKEFEHLLFNCLSPEVEYSVHRYRKEVEQALRDVHAQGAYPLLVGGSGQYLSSLIENIQYAEHKIDVSLRRKLEKEYEDDPQAFQKKVARLDPSKSASLKVQDKHRWIRAREIYELTGRTMSYWEKVSKQVESPWEFKALVFYRKSQDLWKRIEKRLNLMLEQDWIKEVYSLFSTYSELSKTAAQAIGYREIWQTLCESREVQEGYDFMFTHGEHKQLGQKLKKFHLPENVKEKIFIKSRQYAKRQMTWFKNHKDYELFFLEEKPENAKSKVGNTELHDKKNENIRLEHEELLFLFQDLERYFERKDSGVQGR